ncbi:MAG: thiol:disulfide interchange protein DsbA [Halioglobus sp.]
MIKQLLLPLTLLLFALSCSAQEEPMTYVAGKHYDLITKDVARTASRDKIEVAEFFWYGCGHCFTFEPLVKEWKTELADDVEFRPIPAVWRDFMELHARAFYAAEALGVLDTLHPVIFQAMNVDRKRLDSESEIKALFTANGVSSDDFDKAFSSFGVGSQVRQAGSTAKSAGLTGTPSMMVEGKYLISTQKAGSQADMLKVVDFLVEKERAARASAE